MPELKALDKNKYEGYSIDFRYTTSAYYQVHIEHTEDGINVNFLKERFENEVEKGFTSKLFSAYLDDPSAYGIYEGDALVAIMEVTPEIWNNRLRVVNLWVDETCRRKGYGKMLMDYAKVLGVESGRRALVLETQSCNVPAVGFYLAQGLRLIGFNSMDYSNEDIDKKEVRLEMGMMLG